MYIITYLERNKRKVFLQCGGEGESSTAHFDKTLSRSQESHRYMDVHLNNISKLCVIQIYIPLTQFSIEKPLVTPAVSSWVIVGVLTCPPQLLFCLLVPVKWIITATVLDELCHKLTINKSKILKLPTSIQTYILQGRPTTHKTCHFECSKTPRVMQNCLPGVGNLFRTAGHTDISRSPGRPQQNLSSVK